MDDIARLLAEIVNPVFVLLLLAAPWIPRHKEEPPVKFWVGAALGIAVATVLAEQGKALPIWPGHETFPSGHETFGLAAGTALAGYDRDWLLFVVPLAVILGWALVTAGWHEPVDLVGAVLVGPPSSLFCRWMVKLLWQHWFTRSMPD